MPGQPERKTKSGHAQYRHPAAYRPDHQQGEHPEPYGPAGADKVITVFNFPGGISADYDKGDKVYQDNCDLERFCHLNPSPKIKNPTR